MPENPTLKEIVRKLEIYITNAKNMHNLLIANLYVSEAEVLLNILKSNEWILEGE